MRGIFSIKEILEVTGGKLFSKGDREVISGVSTDTRTIKKGDLFIALKGPNFDGHDFVSEALRNGACGAISQLTVPAKGGSAKNSLKLGLGGNSLQFTEKNKFFLVQVKDTLKAYGDIAHYYRMKFNIPFIAITGSNGKTTTKEMIYKVLSSQFSVLKNEGTENNLIGVPKTLLRLNSKHEIGALELGTNRFGEIKRLSQILMPSVGIITNIGPAHLEFLKSKERVFKEKIELVRRLNKDGFAILNADDVLLSKIKRLNCKIIRFGIDKTCAFRATRIFSYDDGIGFIVNDKYEFKIRVLGRHNIHNALAAIALGFLYKVDYDNLYKALLEFEGLKARLCLKRQGGLDIIDDTYNSNPGSLKGAVEVLANYQRAGRRIIVVCGDMLELGRLAEEFHKEAGEIIAKSGIDFLIGVGKFSESLKEAAILNGMDKDAVFSCRDNSTAFGTLKKIIKEGDVVLLKGSRLVRLDEVVDALLSFISAKRVLVRV